LSPLDNPALNFSYLYSPQYSDTLQLDEKNNLRREKIGEEEYKVYLKERTQERSRYLPSQGISTETIELTGYLVTPMFFSENFVIPNELRCRLSVPNGFMEGTLRLNIVPGNPASFIIGQKIQGFFTRKR